MRDENTAPRARTYLPQVIVATSVVALMPIALVWGLRADGMVTSPWLSLALTLALSLLAMAAGNAYWTRRPSSGDIVFSELLPWGWVRRLRIERQLDRAMEDLGLGVSGGTSASAAVTVAGPYARRLELLDHLAEAMEAHDPYVDGHSRRVARHATAVARRLGLPAEEISRVTSAATVHDVGKLRLPRAVLMKPGALTDDEFEVIKRHSAEGARMVECLEDPALTAIVLHHHERLDGTGYPAGLEGADIPLGARIIAVADTFDAITSARPYRPAARHKQAIDILEREAGTQLDAEAVRAFVGYYRGRRLFAVWALLGALPQRALAAVGRGGVVPPGASVLPNAATAAATLAVGAVAVLPPVAGVSARAHARRIERTPVARIVPLASLGAAPFQRSVAVVDRHATLVRPDARRHHRGRVTRDAGVRSQPVFIAQVPVGSPAVASAVRVATPTAAAAPAPGAGSPAVPRSPAASPAGGTSGSDGGFGGQGGAPMRTAPAGTGGPGGAGGPGGTRADARAGERAGGRDPGSGVHAGTGVHARPDAAPEPRPAPGADSDSHADPGPDAHLRGAVPARRLAAVRRVRRPDAMRRLRPARDPAAGQAITV